MSVQTGFLGGRWTALAIVACAAALQFAFSDSPENSWFMTFAEKVLDGATPYVDVSDPNMPAGWLIYMPVVMIARLTEVSADVFSRMEIFATTVGMLALGARILRMADLLPDCHAGYVRNVGLFAFLIAQGALIGERDHFATVCALPILCVYAARASGARVGLAEAMGAGALAAFTMAIKPHFALVFLLPGLYLAIERRAALVLLRAENIAASILLIAYYLGVYVFTPAYFTVTLPEIAVVYTWTRASWQDIIGYPATSITVAELVVIAALATRIRDVRAIVTGLAAAGFAIAYVVQAKLNPYQALPAIELGIVAIAFQFATARDQDGAFAEKIGLRALIPAMAVTPIIAGLHLTLTGFDPYRRVLDTLIAVAPANPTIGAITEQGGLGFPLTRRASGTWVGRQAGLWRVSFGEHLLSKMARDDPAAAAIREIQARDRQELADDLAKGKPDVILVDSEEIRKKELAAPALAHALDDYRKAAVAGEIEIWLRTAHPQREAAARRD